MDILVIIGNVLAWVLIVFGMVFNMKTMSLNWGNMASFIDYQSIAITVGGTFAVLMIAFPGKNFAKIIKHVKILILPQKYDPYDYIDQIVEFAKEARMKGLLSLEDKLNETSDEFLRSSLMLVVDSVEPEKVKEILSSQLEYLDERHAQDRAFYEKGAAFAPAFGMIGTLVGLVLMLGNMKDPDSIGPSMAVALLTTLYGSLLANVIFLPVAAKLKVRHEDEYLCKLLICEGVEAIQAGENPKFIGEKLVQLLPSSTRRGEVGGGGDDDGGKKKGKSKKGK